jgi:hypothetical protein
MSYDPDKLYKLLPSVHRVRDTEEGEPLRELLALITRQVEFRRKISSNFTTINLLRPARHGSCRTSAT